MQQHIVVPACIERALSSCCCATCEIVIVGAVLFDEYRSAALLRGAVPPMEGSVGATPVLPRVIAQYVRCSVGSGSTQRRRRQHQSVSDLFDSFTCSGSSRPWTVDE